MTRSFGPSLRYYWMIVAIGGWRGGPGHKKSIVMAELKPDAEFMIVEALHSLVKREHHDVRRAAVSFPRPTIRQMENIAKRIESRSGYPNMQAISTHSKRVLIATSTSKT
jgi:hypothetical protein